jgi:hypothetical protein
MDEPGGGGLTTAPKAVTDHHLASAAPGWVWWRHVVVRSPGFPAEGVEALAHPGLARRADRLVEAEVRDNTAAMRAFRSAYHDALVAIDGRLQGIARDPRFREAVTWQNRAALDTALEPLLRWRPQRGRHRKHRAHEEVVASYWQRYCVKNDSIGFFGPVGWAMLEPERADVEVRPGKRLTEAADVYFESWAIDALAESIAADARLRPWLRVRRVPFVRIEGAFALVPQRPPVRLMLADTAVLGACDGTQRACDVAGRLRGKEGLDRDDDVFAALERLVAARLVVWALEVSIAPRPERALRALLEAIEEPSLRDAALAKLEQLEAARDRVRNAIGKPAELRGALDGLDDTFRALTGAAPSRYPGETYAGRTIVYHDSRRALDLGLGRPFVEALAPVGLLLESARWLTWEIGRKVRAELVELHDELCAERRTPLDLATLWLASMPLLHRGLEALLDGVEHEYRRRWGHILRCPLDRSQVAYDASELGEAVRTAFAAPASGWAGACYCSPDVMLAAQDADAVVGGEFQLVLGELHLALNALRHECFVAQHPEPGRLLAAADADFPAPRVFAVLPKETPLKLTTRLHSGLVRPQDVHVALLYSTLDPARARVVMSGDVLVERASDLLLLRLPSGEEFDVLDVFGEVLTEAVLDRLRLFAPDEPHVPRISFDDVVVTRERWTFQPSELAFARDPDEACRFVGARRFSREHGLPRHVFVKSALERKPFYVDFDSPVLVGVLAKTARRAPSTLSVTEMLPRPDQTWLVDREGRRYTSELRLAAVDLQRPVLGPRG